MTFVCEKEKALLSEINQRTRGGKNKQQYRETSVVGSPDTYIEAKTNNCLSDLVTSGLIVLYKASFAEQ